MSDRVRIGQIGVGLHGSTIATKLAINDRVDLVACADVDEVAAKRAVDECGFDRMYLDYDRMLVDQELDAVVVITPHHLIRDAAIAAIENGRHVFIEKPMAVDARQGREIVDAARKAGVTVMVGYCQRFAEGRLFIKSIIDRGGIGELVHVNGSKGGPGYSGWLADPEKGGGPLLYVGVHLTDQLLWLTGGEPQRVYSEIAWHPTNGTEQTAAYNIRFEGDVVANMLVTQHTRLIDFLEITGTAGSVRADWPNHVIQVQSDVIDEYRYPSTVRPEDDLGARIAGLDARMYQEEMDSWVAAVAGGREPPVTGEDGLRVLEIIDAVFESGRSGSPVTLK